MKSIRPFVPEDIPQVADLHRRVFATSDSSSPELAAAYRDYFTQVFLDHPWRDELLPSLVDQVDGRIVGFLGVMPRPMRMNGESIRAAICTQFIVDPAMRGLVGLRLLRTFLEGKQDLSLTDEANDLSRRIWEGLGGTTALLYSVHWLRPLRPGRFALCFFRPRERLSVSRLLSGPLERIGPALAGWVTQRGFRETPPQVVGEQLARKRLLACFSEFVAGYALHSEYDEVTLRWLLDRAAQRSGQNSLQMTLVKDDNEKIAGWHLYHASPGRIGEVLQIVAKKHSIGTVLDHLFHHAWQRGMVALSGRLEPWLIDELSARHCLFHHRRGPWMLVQSKRPELLAIFLRGKAFVSKLDGEWCLHFR